MKQRKRRVRTEDSPAVRADQPELKHHFLHQMRRMILKSQLQSKSRNRYSLKSFPDEKFVLDAKRTIEDRDTESAEKLETRKSKSYISNLKRARSILDQSSAEFKPLNPKARLAPLLEEFRALSKSRKKMTKGEGVFSKDFIRQCSEPYSIPSQNLYLYKKGLDNRLQLGPMGKKRKVLI